MNVETSEIKLTAKDFASDQEVRWCPGCGDYAILRAVQKTLADVGAKTEDTVFVSGIGCAARFPYYVSSYGFHTIHGRAPAFATGIKLANPNLDVWVVSGDGDALSIGGNHLVHLIRRNVDVQFLLFNNEIYGLTKGQYSPTSRAGTRSPSTPQGSVETPLSATRLALGAGARFVARGVDSQQKVLPELFKRAHAHKGTSFVEIFQNCIVYNDGVFADFTEKSVAAERQLVAEHGKPLIFGVNADKGLRVKPGRLELEVVQIGEDGISEADILVHDETDRMLATLLAGLGEAAGSVEPVALGVLYCDPAPSYESLIEGVIEDHGEVSPADFNALLRQGNTWTVEG
jgi:2-oxoglutarate/2-oxoacid ferredoxin oxidoreductase subunit beta